MRHTHLYFFLLFYSEDGIGLTLSLFKYNYSRNPVVSFFYSFFPFSLFLYTYLVNVVDELFFIFLLLIRSIILFNEQHCLRPRSFMVYPVHILFRFIDFFSSPVIVTHSWLVKRLSCRRTRSNFELNSRKEKRIMP